MRQPSLKLEQQDAQVLAAGYSKSFRRVEIASIIVFWAEVFGITYRAWLHHEGNVWLIGIAFFVGFLWADFMSGFVHWLGDTWGTTEMPFLGKTLIRPFREHHVDEKAITRHDWVETNGANCLISIPFAAAALVMPMSIPGLESFGLFMSVALGSMIFWVMMTNQFHKWAHLTPEQTPPVVAWLQKYHFILPPEHHQIHHKAPFDTYYCITTGWLNWPLQKLNFYRLSERFWTAVSGQIPRANDIGIEAALKTAPLDPLIPPVTNKIERPV